MKAGKKKLIIARYTPDVYRIAKVIKPNPTNKDAEFVRTRYFLYDNNNRIVDTELKKNDPNKKENLKNILVDRLQKCFFLVLPKDR